MKPPLFPAPPGPGKAVRGTVHGEARLPQEQQEEPYKETAVVPNKDRTQ